VDDNPLNRDVMLRQIHSLGYRADVAASGGEALGLLRHRSYAIVLTDCEMSGMDGYQLAREIRRRERGGASSPLPIIACTANTQPADLERCYKAGMNDHLVKPVVLQQLSQKLTAWVLLQNACPAERSGIADNCQAPVNGQADACAVDWTMLLEVTGNDRKLGAQLLRDFQEQRTELILPLKEALDGADPTAMAAAAHRLKGAARTIGALDLARVCEDIEGQARAGRENGLKELRRAFFREAARLTIYISEMNT
jgi:two-component system sensor histidine kinase/response regulator